MPEAPRPPSRLELIGTTPLRDAIRGRLTGRLDIPAALADLDLPPEIESRIIKSVHRAGIPALHRPVIARDLGQAARAGLDRGLTAEQVLRDWGSRRRTSRRMQLSHDLAFRVPLARRLRRAAWRRGRWALLSFAIFYAVAAARFWTGKPSINRNFAAEWNARIESTPADQRGLPLCLEAWRQYQNPIDVEPSHPDIDFLMDWQTAYPGDPVWPDTVAYLDRNAGALELVRQAAARPYFGWMMSDGSNAGLLAVGKDTTEASSPNPFAISWRFSHLGLLRALARWLNVDARAGVAAGDSGRAHADMLAMLGLADQAREHPTLISDLVGIAIMAMAARSIAEHLDSDPDLWNEGQLAALQERLDRFAGGGDIPLRLDYEHAVLGDILQRLYTDNGSGNGRITAEGIRQLGAIYAMSGRPRLSVQQAVFGPLRAISAPSRRDVRAEWERRTGAAEAQAALPLWQATFPPDRSSSKGSSDPLHRLVDIIMPAIEKAYYALQLAAHERDAARAVIAMHRFRLRHARFPASLDELIPDYLGTLPIDRVDGRPLRYQLIDGEPNLYSLGQDGDDDGGTRGTNPNGTTQRIWLAPDARALIIDGDFVHWPPYPPVRHGPERPVQDLSDSGDP